MAKYAGSEARYKTSALAAKVANEAATPVHRTSPTRKHATRRDHQMLSRRAPQTAYMSGTCSSPSCHERDTSGESPKLCACGEGGTLGTVQWHLREVAEVQWELRRGGICQGASAWGICQGASTAIIGQEWSSTLDHIYE